MNNPLEAAVAAETARLATPAPERTIPVRDDPREFAPPRQERPMTQPAQNTIDNLLATARSNPSKRIQAAAKRAQDAVGRVRDLLAEDAGKAEARAKAKRLEAELRAAKAALKGSTPAAPADAQVDAKAVRAWAAEQGIDVPPVGRVPASVIEQYHAANAAA